MADNYIKQLLRTTFKRICVWKGFRPIAWHVGDEHIHIFLSIPPKYSVSYAVNVIKGKSSAWIKKKTKKIPKGSFWARGYFVSTVGVDEITVKRYVENQSHHQVEFPQQTLL
jgi:putative transposase